MALASHQKVMGSRSYSYMIKAAIPEVLRVSITKYIWNSKVVQQIALIWGGMHIPRAPSKGKKTACSVSLTDTHVVRERKQFWLLSSDSLFVCYSVGKLGSTCQQMRCIGLFVFSYCEDSVINVFLKQHFKGKYSSSDVFQDFECKRC